MDRRIILLLLMASYFDLVFPVTTIALKIVTTPTPELIKPTLVPPTTKTTAKPLPLPSTTNPYSYSQIEYYLLILNCTTHCKMKSQIESQLESDIESKSGATVSYINVLQREEEIVVRLEMKYGDMDSQKNFSTWLDYKKITLNLSKNSSTDFTILQQYSRENETVCDETQRCTKDECGYKEFPTHKCFCSIYYAKECPSWNRNLLWLLIIPCVLIVAILIILCFCLIKKRKNIANFASKKDRYINKYDEVHYDKSEQENNKHNNGNTFKENDEMTKENTEIDIFSNPSFDGVGY